jgi:hypothetical protein
MLEIQLQPNDPGDLLLLSLSRWICMALVGIVLCVSAILYCWAVLQWRTILLQRNRYYVDDADGIRRFCEVEIEFEQKLESEYTGC